MFDKSAHLYDLLYADKDYAAEAAAVIRLVRGAVPQAGRLLDVACGTHAHVRHWLETFAVDGVDLNAAFLEIARERNPDGAYALGDMESFDLQRTYDAVVCLFSSIGYARGLEGLDRAMARLAAHTRPGGVVIVEPWYTPQRWTPGHTSLRTGGDEHVKIARANITVHEGDRSPIRFHYMVATPEGVETFFEDHETWLFTPDQMRAAFERAGLSVEEPTDWPGDRGLYLGRKPG